MEENNKKFFIAGLVLIFLIIILGFGWTYYSRIPVNQPANNSQEENNNSNNGQSQTTTLAPISQDDHLWGDINAPVQLIIYDDFECPFCAEFYDTIEKIKAEFSGKVAIAYRHFPLEIHPNALPAAEASECASEQGKFWEMYAKLFADNKAGQMSIAQFKTDAKDLGLDQAKFDQCLDTNKYQTEVMEQMLGGKNAGVTGTPTTFVNGQFYPGAYPFEDFTARDGSQEKGMKSIISALLQ